MENHDEQEGSQDSLRTRHSNADGAKLAALLGLEPAESALHNAEGILLRALDDVKRVEREIEPAESQIEKAQHHPHQIEFTVDGEEYQTDQRDWTPDQIIHTFGEKNPATGHGHYVAAATGGLSSDLAAGQAWRQRCMGEDQPPP